MFSVIHLGAVIITVLTVNNGILQFDIDCVFDRA